MKINEVTGQKQWYVGSAPTPMYAVKGALMQNPYRMIEVPPTDLKQEGNIWTHLPTKMQFRVQKDTSGEPSEGWAYHITQIN